MRIWNIQVECWKVYTDTCCVCISLEHVHFLQWNFDIVVYFHLNVISCIILIAANTFKDIYWQLYMIFCYFSHYVDVHFTGNLFEGRIFVIGMLNYSNEPLVFILNIIFWLRLGKVK